MKTINNTIKINCDTKDYLNYTDIVPFQGDLKTVDDSAVDKLVKSIKKYGICFPTFIWKHEGKNYIFDGHTRLKAYNKLDTLGFLIPPLPVVYVGEDIDNERDARDLLLRLNSSYGKMSKESVLEFIGDFDIDVTNFELPSGVISFEPELEPIDFGDDEEEKKHGNLQVIVECDSEEELEQTFNKLHKAGYKCRMAEG